MGMVAMPMTLMMLVLVENAAAGNGTTSRATCFDGTETTEECALVLPPSGFVCNSNPRDLECQKVNGKHFCCPPSRSCTDRANYCRFMKGLCTERLYFEMLSRECAATCGRCKRSALLQDRLPEPTFEYRTDSQSMLIHAYDALFPPSWRRRSNCSEGVARPVVTLVRSQSTARNDTVNKSESATPSQPAVSVAEALNITGLRNGSTLVLKGFGKFGVPVACNRRRSLSANGTDRKSQNRSVTTVQPSTILIATLRPGTLANKSVSVKRNLSGATVAVTGSPPESQLTTVAFLRINATKIQERSTAALRKFETTMNLLRETTSTFLPALTTGKPQTFTLSLSKTLIKGRCFDEYIYCREFAALCNHPSFGGVMAKHCSLTCDRCEDLGLQEAILECNDIAENCTESAAFCDHSVYFEIMSKYCAKTCDRCPKLPCKDRHPNCAAYAKDGFCLNHVYDTEERRYLCGESCNLC